jgi:DNA adenine methylase
MTSPPIASTRAAPIGRDRLVSVGPTPRHIHDAPRAFGEAADPVGHVLACGRYQSPLRYPGAKSGFADLIGKLIESAKTSSQVKQIDLLVEPFAGGASTSLRLVGAGIVDRVLLADADPLVATFWQVAAAETEALVDRMASEHARFVSRGGAKALDRWDFWRRWTPPPGMRPATARFESAMKCLFLNRTTFSGILHGQAGPIGGRKQESDYGIGCRFNVEGLAERLRYVGHLYDTRRLVDVWCTDWRQTLADVPEWYSHLIPDRVLAYLDPPYLEKSRKLYQRSFDAGADGRDITSDLQWSDRLLHHSLAEYVRRKIQFRWVLSYDAHPTLLSDPGLYAAAQMTPTAQDRKDFGTRSWTISKRLVSLNYTASARSGRGAVDELLLTTLPPGTVPADDEFRLIGS